MAELHETKLKFDIGRWLPSIGREMSEAEFLNRAVTAFAEMYGSIEAFEAAWEEFKSNIEGGIIAAQETADDAMTLAVNTAVGLETTNANLAATDATVTSNTGRIAGTENELADANAIIADLQERVAALEEKPSGWTSAQISLLEKVLDRNAWATNPAVGDSGQSWATALIAALRGSVPTYTVTFNMMGHGTAISPITGVYAGSTITAPATPTASGYSFGGWYKESGLTNAWNFSTDTVNANTTLYAKWTEIVPGTFTVSFNMMGHGTAIADITAVEGSTISAPAEPTTSGYTFGGWYKESSLTNAWNFSTDTVNANTTLYAKWTAVAQYATIAHSYTNEGNQHTYFAPLSGYMTLQQFDAGTNFASEPEWVAVKALDGTQTGYRLKTLKLHKENGVWVTKSFTIGSGQMSALNYNVEWGENWKTAKIICESGTTGSGSSQRIDFQTNTNYEFVYKTTEINMDTDFNGSVPS